MVQGLNSIQSFNDSINKYGGVLCASTNNAKLCGQSNDYSIEGPAFMEFSLLENLASLSDTVATSSQSRSKVKAVENTLIFDNCFNYLLLHNKPL